MEFRPSVPFTVDEFGNPQLLNSGGTASAADQFIPMIMTGAQVVFPEAEFDVKEEEGIKSEIDIDATGADDEAIDVKSQMKTEMDIKSLPKKVPPLPPRLGPLKMKKKDLRYSPYQDGWKMNPRALPFISREDDPFIYLRPPDTVVPSATVTQEGSPATDTDAHAEDHRTDNEKASARVLSKFASLFGKPLFPINEINLYPTKPKEKAEKQLVLNPLANAFGGPPPPHPRASTATVDPVEPNRCRRAASPSLLAGVDNSIKEPGDVKVAPSELTSQPIKEAGFDRRAASPSCLLPDVKGAGNVKAAPSELTSQPIKEETGFDRRAASQSLLAGTENNFKEPGDVQVASSGLTSQPTKKEKFDNAAIVNPVEPKRSRRAASPSLLATTNDDLKGSREAKVGFSDLTSQPIKEEIFDNIK